MSKGVLLVNLGSPDSTDPKDVKKYLGEFLMDERVIDVPLLARTLLVKGIILNTRPKKSAAAYQKIWWDEGSPLIVLSKRLQAKIDDLTAVPVALAMRYGTPNILSGLQQLHGEGVDEVLLVPLYPQFAMATTETILVLAEELRQQHFPQMKFTSIPAFYKHPDYVQVLSQSIGESLQGLDCCQSPSKAHEFCYRHQCYETTRQVAATLQLKEGSYSTSFQSRLGFDPWLQPYTDRTIERMGKEGITKMAIVTPAFVSDCLETLEEIAMEGEEIFHEVGGKEFTVIPCLNDRDDWSKILSRWIDEWAMAPTPEVHS